MDQKNVFSQVQQLGSSWLKLMAESTTKFAAELAEVEKFEKHGVARAMSAVDEVSRIAKEAINATEELSAQWRKAVSDYAERTLDLIAPKD